MVGYVYSDYNHPFILKVRSRLLWQKIYSTRRQRGQYFQGNLNLLSIRKITYLLTDFTIIINILN